ncbi:MAG TPA: branched-chain amino acid ABC transporter permease [Spirochaetota bacterium]|nr:branched-chain amino acid ABC transporter permease [Spirochaetota bacterium]HOM38002.1 branched-chain amino acid ABC transporter permease [Spirochaetota bacterium]HPQ48806.1 branched-chain amino acid ABC transporter permease [Spirochaetota bacterium]
MSAILVWIWLIIGVVLFLMAFIKDTPSTKKTYKLLAFLFVITLPFTATSWLSALNSALLYSILAMGLNLLLGNAGQISLGHAAFYALGAYATAILSVKAGVPILISIILGGISVSILAFIIGTPILRLKGHFLGIATLGLHIVVENIIKNELKHMFPGATVPIKYTVTSMVDSINYALREKLAYWDYVSLTSGTKPFIFNYLQDIASNIPAIAGFFITLLVLYLIVLMVRNLLKTKVGRALGGIRDSEVAARTLGVNIALYKNIAFGLSAFIAGIAGGIFAITIGTVDEASFMLTVSLYVLAMIVIGGVGTIQGSIIGATLYQLLDMKIIKTILPQKYQALALAIMGIAVILMIIFAPKGIVYMLYQFKLKIMQKKSGFVKK